MSFKFIHSLEKRSDRTDIESLLGPIDNSDFYIEVVDKMCKEILDRDKRIAAIESDLISIQHENQYENQDIRAEISELRSTKAPRKKASDEKE